MKTDDSVFNPNTIKQIKNYLISLQSTICQTLEQQEKTVTFKQDPWQHNTGGGGRTCVIDNGDVFEKGAVNFSHVRGTSLPASATEKRPELKGCSFQALGVSLVIHPENPFVPTVHANIRFIVSEQKNHEPIWWFGGGYDLTPTYGFEEDCIHWHNIAKKTCSSFGDDVYPRFKKWCDDYFFIKHRNEPRGVGGLFFDDLNYWSLENSFSFIQAVGNSFISAYLPIVAKRKNIPFTEQNKRFQQYRRNRYVEFNLIYDRGTLFGLQSGGRVESILISMPPTVRWDYNCVPKPKSEEEKLYTNFLVPRSWATI